MEKELKNSINCLDLTISRVDKHSEFKIYRKDTFTDTIIPACSNHPINIKLSVFHSLINRLLKVPLSSSSKKYYLKKPINKI